MATAILVIIDEEVDGNTAAAAAIKIVSDFGVGGSVTVKSFNPDLGKPVIYQP